MKPIPLDKWVPGLTKPLIIAGSCSAESEQQVMETARGLAQIDQVKVFRAGIWKPRTRPNCFEGVGDRGLPWLKRVKEETGLMTATEVATPLHVEMALKNDVDILWIGARTTVNPFNVKELAEALRGVGCPVLVKNPVNADIALWIGALERMVNAGVNKLAAVHRGFSTYDQSKYRNPPMWRLPIELKRRYPDIPLICDPSHISGKRELLFDVCQKALDIGVDGLMIECHCDPSVALSDAEQQVTPETLGEMLNNFSLPKASSHDEFEEELETLRIQIDRSDNEIMEWLQMRMQVVEHIGKVKAKNQMTAVQIHRMNDLINSRIKMGAKLGLNANYIRELFNIIHEESVRNQTRIMRENKKRKNELSKSVPMTKKVEKTKSRRGYFWQPAF